MDKNTWLAALDKETRENASFAFLWSMAKLNPSYKTEDALLVASSEFQKATKARRKTRNANQNRKMREDIMRSCGLTKVYGSVSGKVYWE
jgi:hypothetical protein